MKKLLLFCVMCLLALTMNAQRCAVLEFRAGAGISQADVDGISGIFITYFRPSGYTMVERTQIDRAIDEQGFQRSRMTESQMVRLGAILNVSKIVIGDVNIVMGQYNVDTRVINVETGSIIATEGATFDGSSYRTTMQSIAQSLASKISIMPTPAGYVNLGLPSGTYWKKKNESGLFAYDEAFEEFGNQLPTKEQWEELIIYCTWTWIAADKGWKVVGPSGAFIILPLGMGYYRKFTFRDSHYVNNIANYWSSTPTEKYEIFNRYMLSFDSKTYSVSGFGDIYKDPDTKDADRYSVRLVHSSK